MYDSMMGRFNGPSPLFCGCYGTCKCYKPLKLTLACGCYGTCTCPIRSPWDNRSMPSGHLIAQQQLQQVQRWSLDRGLQ